MRQPSPSRRAVVARPARSDPASLAESLTPPHLAVQKTRQEPPLLLFGAVLENASTEIAHPRRFGCACVADLLVHDGLISGRQRAAAVLDGPRDGDPTAREQHPVPRCSIRGYGSSENRVIGLSSTSPELAAEPRELDTAHRSSRNTPLASLTMERNRASPAPKTCRWENTRRRWRWAGCSQVMATPPKTWMAPCTTSRVTVGDVFAAAVEIAASEWSAWSIAHAPSRRALRSASVLQ